VHVIIRSTTAGSRRRSSAFTHVNQFADDDRGGLDRRLSLIDGVSATVQGSALPRLMRMLEPDRDACVQVHVKRDYNSGSSGRTSPGASQDWSGSTRLVRNTADDRGSSTPGSSPGGRTSGTQPVKANVNFSTLLRTTRPATAAATAPFVAGIAAGRRTATRDGPPQANLVSPRRDGRQALLGRAT
jgi:hypothetical protein